MELPSVGSCMNDSKAEARLDMATLLLGLLFVRGRIGFGLRPGLRNRSPSWWTCSPPNLPLLSLALSVGGQVSGDARQRGGRHGANLKIFLEPNFFEIHGSFGRV